jgi:hypothetical protein
MNDETRNILDKLIAAADRDPLRLPDLQEWVAAFGGYSQFRWRPGMYGTRYMRSGSAGNRND